MVKKIVRACIFFWAWSFYKLSKNVLVPYRSEKSPLPAYDYTFYFFLNILSKTLSTDG